MANFRDKHNYKVVFFTILVLFLFCSNTGISQNLQAYFLKPVIRQDAGNIIFNVVRIKNISTTNKKITPVLLLPEGWKSFGGNIPDTIVFAGDSISLAYRMRVPRNAKAEINHKIIFQIFSNRNQLLFSTDFLVQTNPFHDWEIIMPKERVYFFPGNDRAVFEIKLVNNGNTPEAIDLNMVSDKKIKLTTLNEDDIPELIMLRPGSDTTIKLMARYTYSEERIFDLSKIHVHASSAGNKFYRSILLEKYSDNYNPFEIDNTLAQQVEVGVRTFSHNDEFLPFIRTNGKTDINEISNFKYNFTYYDLTQTENIIGNSYYHFLYTREELKVGLGAFSSMLGRNLYNRNSVMVADKIRLSKTGQLEGFASYGFVESRASAAFAYYHETDKVNMDAAVSYDFDEFRKINTASFTYHSNRIKLMKSHEVSASVYAYNEQHYHSNKYSLAGIAYDLNYFGQISKRLKFQITNNYGSPNIPGPQMGLLNFYAKANLATSNPKHHFSFKYVNTTKNYYLMTFDGRKLPDVWLHDQYGSIMFHSFSGKIHRWAAGPSIEFYKSIKPQSNANYDEIYSVRKYRMEYRSFIGTKLSLSVKAGLGDISYQTDELVEKERYDLHILGDYNFGGYGFRLSYDYGPMVNTGIYQFVNDVSNNSINLSPYVMKQVFKNRVRLVLFTNLSYLFDRKYGYITVDPKIETYVFKDWYFVIGGTYSYVNQEYKGSRMESSHYYTEFSIKKRWGKSDYKKWQKDLRRVKIVFFQDNNGNGIKDNFEEGIPHVKARLLLINSADQKRTAEFPTDLTLLSNDKGNVIFSRIPMGFYELTITPLVDQKEYFYVSKTAEKIEVTKTDVYYIPFQKASKIEGRIQVSHRKYSLQGDHIHDLANIKVTAISSDGDTYSAFTLKDGSFVLFAPSNNIYFLRMSNVFGKDFRILQNDIKVVLPNPKRVVFNVVERSRSINFKKAKPQKEGEPKLQKIKVLPGKIYAGEKGRLAEQNPLPQFNIKDKPADAQVMLKGKYYVVVCRAESQKNADEYVKILKENGLLTHIGIDSETVDVFIFTNYYSTKKEAKDEIEKLKASGIKKTEIYYLKE